MMGWSLARWLAWLVEKGCCVAS